MHSLFYRGMNSPIRVNSRMNYPVLCYGNGCAQPARYKIAASWSHGASSELKTYGLSCEGCLAELYLGSIERQKKASMLPGELGERPGIYCLVGQWSDRELLRDIDREQAIAGRSES